MLIEGHWRLAIYLGVGDVLAGSGVGIGLSQSTSGHGAPRSRQRAGRCRDQSGISSFLRRQR